MARVRVRTSQTAFTSGELAEELDGRLDQERYFKGARELLNWRLRPLGGATRRPGTTFVAPAKTGAVRVQLMSFIARQSIAYAIEMGEAAGAGYMRFFRNNGQIISAPDLLVNGNFDVNLGGWSVTGAASWLGGQAHLPPAAERIMNGHFSTSMTGWNFDPGPVASGGVCVLGTAGWINQTRTLVPVSTYTFRFRILNNSCTVTLTNSNFPTAVYPPGVYSVTVVTTSTTLLVQFDARPSPPGSVSVDDISLIQQAVIRQDVTVVPGTEYRLAYKIANAAGLTVRVGSTSGGGELLDITLPSGTYTTSLAAPGSTLSLTFAGEGDVDEVSVRAPAGPHEIASPYLAGDLPKVRHAPSADVLYLACEGYPPQKLTRTSDTGWTLIPVNFRPPATEEKPIKPGTTLTLGATSGTGVSATTSAPTWLAGDVNRVIQSGTGRAVITAVTSATVATVDILDPFASTAIAGADWTLGGSPNATVTASKKEPVGGLTTLTASINVWRPTDVGKYVRIQNGLVKITVYSSGLVVTGEIMSKLDATTGTTLWTLEVPSWDDTDGWPIDVGFSAGDRLVWGRGDRIWASVVGDYENMTPGTLDDQAFTLALRTSEVSEIRGIVGASELQLFTTGAEFVVAGGPNDAPLTPTNFRIASDTTYGAARVRVIRVNGQSIFTDRSGRGLREQVFDISVSRHVSVDLMQLAQHLFPSGLTIADIAFQRSPDTIIWALRSDGVLCGLTYLRAEQVVGWWRMETLGQFESLCVIPHPDNDREQVWVAAARTVGGSVARYIERIDDTSLFKDTDGVPYGQKNTDSTLSYSGAPISVLGGLGHLEGRAVDVVADGRYLGTFIVVSGRITLPAAYGNIEAGLGYLSRLVTVRPELQVQGTTQGVKKRNARIMARLYRTASLRVNGHQLAGLPPGRLVSGDRFTANLGWDRDGRITIEQDQPLPATITMLTSLMGVGG